MLADPEAKTRFAELGAILLPGSAADFGKLLADETEKWGKVVKFSGARGGLGARPVPDRSVLPV